MLVVPHLTLLQKNRDLYTETSAKYYEKLCELCSKFYRSSIFSCVWNASITAYMETDIYIYIYESYQIKKIWLRKELGPYSQIVPDTHYDCFGKAPKNSRVVSLQRPYKTTTGAVRSPMKTTTAVPNRSIKPSKPFQSMGLPVKTIIELDPPKSGGFRSHIAFL